jgi:hypothetical protein
MRSKTYIRARDRFENDRMRYETACSNERVATTEQERAKAAAERRLYRYAMDRAAEDLRLAERADKTLCEMEAEIEAIRQRETSKEQTR